MEQSSYYAVIPAHVRYCKDVPDGAKLLYGEITALCNSQGYCWASNKYFSDLYGKSSDTISRWISQLARAGFILTMVDNVKGNTRKIWLSESQTYRQKSVDPIGKNADTLPAKMPRGYRQKSVDPIGKNAVPYKENNTVNITMNNTGEGKGKILPPPFTKTGEIEIPENVFPLEAKNQNELAGAGPGGAMIVTTYTPQEPYTRVVEMVAPGPQTPGEKIRAMIDAGNYKIKEVFSTRNKIQQTRFEEYLDAFNLEQTALPMPTVHKSDNDLVTHFWNWSGIRWGIEQRTKQGGQQTNTGRGAAIVRSGGDPAKYEEKQVF